MKHKARPPISGGCFPMRTPARPTSRGTAWPVSVRCPRSGHKNVHPHARAFHWQCRNCAKDGNADIFGEAIRGC